ncbi:MAG: hypothetical protein IKC37_02370, partial [Clostridia bacterium]|nr:hypothetical protein [Clostridia bacterium]
MKKSFFKKLYITIATGVFSLALALGFISMQPVTQKADAASSFSLQKTSFVEGEAIYVSATGSGTDWVGIFREGESSSVLWYYVAQNPSPFNILNGTPNAGESAASVTAGNYVVAYVPNDLPGIANATQTQPITVLPASSPSAQMSLNKTSFVEGEPINVTAFGSGTDWVGIYREGQNLSARWYYVANAGSGATVNIATYGNNNEGNGISATISAGNYVVYLIRNDGDYTSAEIAIPITVSKASALRVEKTEFELKQPIFVTATHSDPNAWVGLYRSTESSYCRWYYVSSANGVPYDITNGEKNIEASYSPNVMRGDYYLRLFDDDGAVVEEIAISVIADPTIPSAPLSATYSLEKDTDGYATGTVSVTMPTSDLTDRCIALFWGDDDGVFENYSYTKFKVTGETTSFTFGKNVIIPFGATKLYVYAKNTNGDALSTTPVIVDLPQGASQKNPLNSTGNSFWVISDTHVDQDVNHVHNQHFAGLLQDIARIDGGAMSLIVNGDMTNRGRDEDWANFQAIYDAATGVPPMVLAMGNHEYYSGTYEYVNSKFYELAKYPDGTLVNKMHYDYWQGGYHFVFLGTDTWPQNNTHAVLTQETLNWLDATLDDGKDEHKPTFLFLHQPLYNTVAGSRPGEDYSGVEASSEAALRTILADHPEVMLFVGHTHWTMNAEANMYEGTAELPVRMFNTSSAGYLWTTYDNASGDYLYGSEGYYLRVDGSTLYVMGYDFVNDQWISAAQYCIELDPATDEGGNETVPPVHDCTDEDDDHLCDVCEERLSDCTDREDDGDHNCDVCGESYGTHDYNSGRWSCTQTQHAPYCECGLTGTYENHYDSPKDGDHFCDTCNYPTSTCADNDNDHDCDDCGTTLSSCEDLDKNHVCDLCNDKDHFCDVCDSIIGECDDLDSDHLCDV